MLIPLEYVPIILKLCQHNWSKPTHRLFRYKCHGFSKGYAILTDAPCMLIKVSLTPNKSAWLLFSLNSAKVKKGSGWKAEGTAEKQERYTDYDG